MNRNSSLLSALVAVLFVAGCGASISEEDASKSQSQYELAVGLNDEGNLPAAFQALARAIEINPYNAKAHLFLGTLYLLIREEDPEQYDPKAEQSFRKVIEIQAGDYAFRENLAAEAHNKLGVLYIHTGRYSDAVRELKIAVGDLFNRRAYLAWGNLGWVYSKMDKPEKAIQALRRAIELQPRFCVGYYRLGEVYASRRDFEKAETVLTKALEAHERCETFQQAWKLRGEVRAKLGEREDAISDLERCVELSPDSESGQECSRLLESAN
jgi:tetratricopeptide (TPR) repeat protein